MEIDNEKHYVYSEGVRDILSEPPRSIFRWGNTILFGFVALLISISWFVKYPDVVVAQSIVTSQNPPVLLSPIISDKIDKIYFTNNSIVNQGEWIAVLGNNTNLNHVKVLDSLLKDISSKEYDIQHILNINLPILQLGDIQTSYNSFLRLTNSFKHHLEDGNFKIQSNLQSLQLQEYNNLINSALNDRRIAEKELEISKNNLDRHKYLFEKGIIAKLELENQELQHLQNVRNFESQDARIYQLRSQKLSLNSQQSDLGHSEEETILNNELNIYEAVKNTELSLETWIKSHVIMSPIKGVLKYLQNVNVNQTVLPSSTLFTVIPEEEGAYICDLRVPIFNSGKVKVGQEVSISLDGFNPSEFGLLKAEITDFSNVPNENYFQATARLKNGLATTHGKQVEYLKNLSGSAQIITEDLRLIERFFYQIIEVFKRS